MSGSQTREHPEVEEDHGDGKPYDPRMVQDDFRRWTKATMLSREYIEVVESRERAVVKNSDDLFALSQISSRKHQKQKR